MDVLADARELLDELGVRFESSASGPVGRMLAASINYPLRGAVTWKSTVGTNWRPMRCPFGVGRVLGGALRSSARTTAKRQHHAGTYTRCDEVADLGCSIRRPDTSAIVDMVERGFELSEASQTPVMLMLRIRACHMHGSFVAKDNVARGSGFRTRSRIRNDRRRESFCRPARTHRNRRR